MGIRNEDGSISLYGITSREQAERLARHRDPCRVPPAGWDCTREPGHDGPCAAVPSMIREHLGELDENSGRPFPLSCGDGGE